MQINNRFMDSKKFSLKLRKRNDKVSKVDSRKSGQTNPYFGSNRHCMLHTSTIGTKRFHLKGEMQKTGVCDCRLI